MSHKKLKTQSHGGCDLVIKVTIEPSHHHTGLLLTDSQESYSPLEPSSSLNKNLN